MTQATETTKPETNRDRVRRLLIAPLQRDGMRFPKDVSDDVQRKRLDQVADDLAHMSDHNLGRLMLCLRTKGDGSAKCFWPGRVTIIGYAEAAQPRPIADNPRLRSWFASAAGARAAGEPGRLVAEFEFFERHKHPPFAPQHQSRIKERAANLAHRVERIADREGRGAALSPEDAAWIVHYRKRLGMITSWLDDADGAA
jgi:hypothetical protein